TQQPWFDGRLGMWGGSAFGHTQWAIADTLPAPPSGRSALMVQIASTDFHGMFYPGGAFSLASGLFWAMRSRGPEDVLPDAAALQRGVDGFPLVEADDRAVGVVAPVLLAAGWFDPFLPGQLADFVRIKRDARADVAAETRLVIGPWGHAETMTLPGGVHTRNYRLESLAPSIPWFDRHLRWMGRGVQPGAPVRLFVMGANVRRDEQEWPLARARETSWYLRSGGHANSAAGDGGLSTDAPTGDERPDTFESDPLHPVPTRGGAVLSEGGGVA